MVKDKASLSYPDVNKKKKKIVRKEIKIARVDTADGEFIDAMRVKGVQLPSGGATIMIVHKGSPYKYDGLFADVNMLVH